MPGAGLRAHGARAFVRICAFVLLGGEVWMLLVGANGRCMDDTSWGGYLAERIVVLAAGDLLPLSSKRGNLSFATEGFVWGVHAICELFSMLVPRSFGSWICASGSFP